MLVGVALLLLMAAVNVANLVLARSVARQRELAVRAALGASRLRLARQSLTESVILALAGAALGLLFVRWGVEALVALAPADIPRMQDVSPDSRVVAVTVVVGVATGLLIGLLPALSSASTDAAPALQDHSRGTVGSRSRRRLRSTLVVVEVALAVVLTVGAGLLIRSFMRLMNVDPGFRPESLLTLQMNIPDRLVNEANRPVTSDARRAFYEDLLDRLEAIPGVMAVGGTTRIPLGSSSVTTSLQVEGREPTGQLPEVEFRRVMHDFFPAMGTPIVRGRGFAPEDGPTAPSVVVVNETIARRVFGSADPIGQHVRTGPHPTGPWRRWSASSATCATPASRPPRRPRLYVNYLTSPPVAPFIASARPATRQCLPNGARRSAGVRCELALVRHPDRWSRSEPNRWPSAVSCCCSSRLRRAGAGAGRRRRLRRDGTGRLGAHTGDGRASRARRRAREVLGMVVRQAVTLGGHGRGRRHRQSPRCSRRS